MFTVNFVVIIHVMYKLKYIVLRIISHISLVADHSSGDASRLLKGGGGS